VNQISIDENGDYIASCSDDGRVLSYDILIAADAVFATTCSSYDALKR